MYKYLLCIIAVLLLSGCATIFTGSFDNVTFKSIPDGAKVHINGNLVGKTPMTLLIKRNISPPQVMFRLDDYESRHIMMNNSFNVVSIFNFFFWPGFFIDLATGALMKYDVVTYEADLEAKKK
ncbi:MAG: PEGA domain-containing protein [Endozoicomonadaceae bacterium]|nr:PEGA domain-containing protein [Endozoicomonadaceae bacterium]